MKSIKIFCKEYRDVINGNSYMSCQIHIEGYILYVPFQYGYGTHYLNVCAQKICSHFSLSEDLHIFSRLQGKLEPEGWSIEYEKQTNCKIKEVKEFGIRQIVKL